MEYLYIIGIVGYYLYKAYSSNKKKQEENQTSVPEYETNVPPKKKKGLFDEILEEIEKANKGEQYKPQPVPVPVQEMPKVRKQSIPPKAVKKEQQEWQAFESDFTAPFESNFTTLEGQRSTLDLEAEEVKVLKERKFAGMNMSPKEALKAQIILEKKF